MEQREHPCPLCDAASHLGNVRIRCVHHPLSKAVKEDVILVPGGAFGEEGKEFIRLSYAQSYDNLAEAMKRLEKIA